MRLAYYVSGHGFGHISRSYELARELVTHSTIDHVYLNTTRTSFIESASEKIIVRNLSTDVGMIQRDSLSIDIPATIKAIQTFKKQKPLLIEQELTFLRQQQIDAIITDSSSLPMVFAQQLAIPAIFIGNFSWDFIYQHYGKQQPFFQQYSRKLQQEYELAHHCLQLPFSCPLTSMKHRKAVGLLGRSPKYSKQDIRKKLGFNAQKKYFLYSFGAYGIDEEKFDFSNKSEDHIPVVANYSGFAFAEFIHINQFAYADVVAACDYVVTKPGYGILSECYLAKTPILFTERGDFPEYPYLIQYLQEYFPAAYLSHDEIYRFQFSDALASLRQQSFRGQLYRANTEIATYILALLTDK